jgi:hypothetical protein
MGVVRGASHLLTRRGREDTKSALEDPFLGDHSPQDRALVIGRDSIIRLELTRFV